MKEFVDRFSPVRISIEPSASGKHTAGIIRPQPAEHDHIDGFLRSS